MPIIFSESSGLNNSVFGKCEAPIKMFLEKRGQELERTSMLKELFCMNTSTNYGDMYTGMTAMDGFDPVGENGAYPSDSMQEGNSKLIVYETWKDSFSISKEMIEDSKAMDMKKRPAQFMQAYHNTREKFGAALYAAAINGANVFKYRGKDFDSTGADKLGLFANAHRAVVKGKPQSNRFSDTFSVDTLGKMETAMHLFRGENNEILDVAPDTILIPEVASLKQKVFAAIGADKDPVTANNAFNYQYGRWSVIIWPYLNEFIDLTTNPEPFILLDSKYNENYQGAIWTDRIQLEIKPSVDENTDAAVWRGRSRFNAGFNDWRFAALGGVSSGTAL